MEISNTAINRVVAHQWSNLPNQNWSGNYNGLNYDISINRPSVILKPNKIECQLSLTISSSANGQTVYDGTLSINPELGIPANTIELGNIVTQYINLRQSIDQLSVLVGVNDSRLNQVIENILSPIDWIMYSGNAIEQSQVRWSDEADIRWSVLPDISYMVSDGSIEITVTPEITAIKPDYLFTLNRNGNTLSLTVKSNNEISISYIWFYYGSQLIVKSAVNSVNSFNEQTNQFESVYTISPTIPAGLQQFNTEFVVKRGNFSSQYHILWGTVTSPFTGTRNLSTVNNIYHAD